jgi:hypothetical protein
VVIGLGRIEEGGEDREREWMRRGRNCRQFYNCNALLHKKRRESEGSKR